MEWKVKESVKGTILQNLNEIIDALVEKYVPRFLVSLVYDEENKELFVTEPYTTSTRLPWRVLITIDNTDFDIEGVVLDTSLPPYQRKEMDDYVHVGQKLHTELIKECLFEYIVEEAGKWN